jgi:hypothetical protein
MFSSNGLLFIIIKQIPSTYFLQPVLFYISQEILDLTLSGAAAAAAAVASTSEVHMAVMLALFMAGNLKLQN